MGFDLTATGQVIEQEEAGRVVHVYDVTGEPMYHGEDPVTVTVVGTYSKRYRDALEVKRDKRLVSARGKPDADSIREDALDVTATCVIGWHGFFDDGEPMLCNKGNVLRVLKAAPWVREQIEQAMEDHAGFSASSSSN